MGSLRIGDVLYVYNYVLNKPIKALLITKIGIKTQEKMHVFGFQEQIPQGSTVLPLFRHELSYTAIVIGDTIFSSTKEEILAVKGQITARSNYKWRK